jgi:hypothetical protein
MTLSIMTLSTIVLLVTLSMIDLIVTLSIKDIQHNGTKHMH